MHGITRTRNLNEDAEDIANIYHVVVRYSDGRTLTFTPEAGRETFSEDDMLELKKILTRASATAEWSEVGDAQRGQ